MSDHPFTYDRWALPDDPEFGVVRVDDLRKIERACLGIWAIARIVGNSANEPGATGARPLDGWVVSNLMGGVEGLCDQVSDLSARALVEPPWEPLSAKPATPIHQCNHIFELGTTFEASIYGQKRPSRRTLQ